MRIFKNDLKKNRKNGFSFIEVLIAMFILVVVGIAFLVTLQYALKANMLDDARSTAESIARSQIESIKKEAYLDYSKAIGDPKRLKDIYNTVPFSGDYRVTITVEPIVASTGNPYAIDGATLLYVQDDGIQRITVLVEYNTTGNPNIWDASVSVEGYKVNR